MAVTDLADAAAVEAAGYAKVQINRLPPGDHDLNPAPRYVTRYDKLLLGAGQDGAHHLVVEGEGVSRAAADANALVKLNALRRHRYAGSPGRPSGSADSLSASGGTHQVDVT